MDVVVVLALATLAVLAWLLVAGGIALLAGRVIHERDAHDRPGARSVRISRPALLHR